MYIFMCVCLCMFTYCSVVIKTSRGPFSIPSWLGVRTRVLFYWKCVKEIFMMTVYRSDYFQKTYEDAHLRKFKSFLNHVFSLLKETETISILTPNLSKKRDLT